MSLDSKLHDAQSMRNETRTLDCWLEKIFFYDFRSEKW